MPVKHTYLSGQEVADGYAEITTSFAYSTDNTIVDVTGLTITFTPLQASVMVRLGGWCVTGLTGKTPNVVVTDGSNNVVAQATETCLTGALIWTMPTIERRLTLTPGTSYTYKARTNSGGGTPFGVTLNAQATNPFWIQAVYL